MPACSHRLIPMRSHFLKHPPEPRRTGCKQTPSLVRRPLPMNPSNGQMRTSIDHHPERRLGVSCACDIITERRRILICILFIIESDNPLCSPSDGIGDGGDPSQHRTAEVSKPYGFTMHGRPVSGVPMMLFKNLWQMRRFCILTMKSRVAACCLEPKMTLCKGLSEIMISHIPQTADEMIIR